MNEIKNILLIHPEDRTTKFLNRIKNHLAANLQDIHYYSVKPNELSHLTCIERIRLHPKNGTIIFLGHGSSDKLHGSKGRFWDQKDVVSIQAVNEFPELYYANDSFITKDNIEIFKNKKVFFLACRSNEDLAQFAIQNGVSSYIGFGNIPTSLHEFNEIGFNSSRLVMLMKREVNYIIKRSLLISIKKYYTFEDLYNIMQLITSQRINDIRISKTTNQRIKYHLIEQLYCFRREVSLVGDKRLKIIE